MNTAISTKAIFLLQHIAVMSVCSLYEVHIVPHFHGH